MILLAQSNISHTTNATLNHLQSQIDLESTFQDKVEKAQELWQGKSGSKTNIAAFNEVKDKLEEMCVSVKICNYCEQNEANDIEHIYPKSFFPERAFKWDNYLLACKQCNSGYKLDRFSVLDPSGNL